MEITTNDIASVLDRSAKCGNKMPPIFLAPYGIGKSYSAAAWAAATQREYIDLRLAYYTFNEVRGFGVPDRDRGVMTFLPTEEFPQDPNGRYLVHWEELTNCMPQTQKVALQGFLDRRVGNYRFPADTIMMASGNRLKDKAHVERMSAALMNRMAVYHVRPDLSSFMGYLGKHGQSDIVFAFIQANQNAPYDYKIAEWDGESNLPTFRSFERLDELMASYADSNEVLNDPLLPAEAVARVGPKHGRMFAEFAKLTAAVGDVGQMIDDADRCAIPDRVDLRWIIGCKVIGMATKDNIENCLVLAHRLNDPARSNPDDLLMIESFVGNTIRRRREDILRTPTMVKWVVKHGKQLSSI